MQGHSCLSTGVFYSQGEGKFCNFKGIWGEILPVGGYFSNQHLGNIRISCQNIYTHMSEGLRQCLLLVICLIAVEEGQDC